MKFALPAASRESHRQQPMARQGCSFGSRSTLLVLLLLRHDAFGKIPEQRSVRLHSRRAHLPPSSFLELGSEAFNTRAGASMAARARAQAQARSWRSYYRAVHNNTHAIEYSGEIQVGGQSFNVIFDTGSDRLIVPSSDCVSDACQKHQLYDSSKSTTAANISDPEPVEATFGTGHVEGYEAEDRVCVGDACAQASF